MAKILDDTSEGLTLKLEGRELPDDEMKDTPGVLSAPDEGLLEGSINEDERDTMKDELATRDGGFEETGELVASNALKLSTRELEGNE